MPFCPHCAIEYPPEAALCEHCGAALVDSPPEGREQSALEDNATELVELAEFPNASEAEMIQELLEGNGIRTVLRGDVDPIGVVSGAAPSALLVERMDLMKARQLYEDYFAGDQAVEPGDEEADEQQGPEEQ